MGPFGNGYFIRYIATLYIVLTACGKYLILRVHTIFKKRSTVLNCLFLQLASSLISLSNIKIIEDTIKLFVFSMFS